MDPLFQLPIAALILNFAGVVLGDGVGKAVGDEGMGVGVVGDSGEGVGVENDGVGIGFGVAGDVVDVGEDVGLIPL